MRVAVLYVTAAGRRTAEKLKSALGCDCYGKEDFGEGLKDFTGKLFRDYEGIVFLTAAGIAVRCIAPYIKHKTEDPAVIAADDGGRFVISLLSGHLGGANRLAAKIAEATGGQAVITTATDNHKVVSFDLFAQKNGCVMENIEVLKTIGAALLDGREVGFFTDCPITGDMPPLICEGAEKENNVILTNSKKAFSSVKGNLLFLRPKNLVLGIGCKKGTPREAIEAAVFDFLDKNGRVLKSVKCLSSIDLKKDEKGILDFCESYKIPFVTLPQKRLADVEDEFEGSDFVKRAVGVSSVAEACAKYTVKNSRVICKKTVYMGITLSLGEILYMYQF